MGLSNPNFDTDVLPVVRLYAKVAFANDNDRPTKTADCVSEAWRLFSAITKPVPAKSIAWYAVRRVKAGRHFQQSSRSITGPNPRRRAKAERSEFDVGKLAKVGDNPALVAAMLVDFPAWFEQLNLRQKEACVAMLMGESTAELAEQFGVSPGAVSQTRRWLVENWLAFTA